MKSEVLIVPAVTDHLSLFALEFTAEEEAEAAELGQASAEAAFAELLDGSLEAWCGLRDGRVGFMLGVRRRIADGEAQLWFHSVRYFAEHGVAFVRRLLLLIAQLLERHGVLHGLADPRRPAMRRLMEWAGFELASAQPFGPLGQMLHPAVLRRA